MMFRSTAFSFALLTALALSGCGGATEASSAPSPTKTSAPTPTESVDAEDAKEDCELMTALLSGMMPETGMSLEEMTSVLAANGTGEVKNTAEFILEQVDNPTASSEEQEEVIEKFKDFCRPYMDE